MLKRFSIIIFFILFAFFSYTQEKNRNITFVVNEEKILSKDILLGLSYMVDLAESVIINENKDVILSNIKGEVDPTAFKKVVNYIFSHGITAFYYINAIENDTTIDIDIKLFNSIGILIHEDKLIFNYEKKFDNYISKKIEKRWIDIIKESIEKVSVDLGKRFFNKKFIRKSFKFEHDFPIFSLSLTALSAKMYFDYRMVDKINDRVFSVFPINIKLTFFPLRYFETGLFSSFNLNNMVYNYYDNKLKKYKYYDANFVFLYGIFAGLSFFYDNNHYSIGIEVSNLFYNLITTPTWAKTQNINSYFLPQFSLYQKLDFKIFKFVYFSISFNYFTLPMFNLKNNYFYSKPLWYDFFGLQVSFVGISIII